ncbi:DNA-processing protein DprA [Niallia sp. FSL W8-0635]|uniref:DNA-processing protein DprA n=1 Tax=Niallia sp. FSL W8-0635 TaxID=2975337 RepID=UPI0009CC440C|nr:DNA protecting protein DprA [Mycobacteroides abscessus subsp. abscessus]HEO8419026.1 DNA-protecting protein DprA [Yersinia enterocolitica]
MEIVNKSLIKLHHCRGISWKIIGSLLKADPTLQLHKTPSFLSSLPPNVEKEIVETLHSNDVEELLNQYRYNQIHAIPFFDPLYPPFLKEIYQPPWVLYAKGDVSLLHSKKKLAIVGSRLATTYSTKVIKQLINELVEEKITIVSGLAHGVDSIAHKLTIENGGKTIGVIAGGLFHIYPKENRELAGEMMKHHLVLSEYPPLTKPLKWQFPMRNRIISGLSNGTLVVEAKKKSGSLITANFAVNEGRDVFAVPGNIFSPYSDGPNELIQQGAKPVLEAKDIIEEWKHLI